MPNIKDYPEPHPRASDRRLALDADWRLELGGEKDRAGCSGRRIAMIIYMIVNKCNGKAYIGMTRQALAARYRNHRLRGEGGHRGPLYAAMKKYGITNFQVSIIAEAETYEELSILEREQINKHGTMCPKGYNLAPGGHGNKGYKKRPEDVEKTAAWHRGKKRSEETRKRMSLAVRKKYPKRSAEAIEKTRIANLGRKRTPEQRDAISRAQTGKILSEKTKAKISASMKGRKKNPEAIEKTAATKRGKPLSSEHKDKLKKAWERRRVR